MELEKVYESLQLDKLDEEKQKEIKDYLQETIDLKAKELAESKVEEEKEKLVEHYEQKFEEYKEDITSKFSNFVDDVMNEELQIPDKVKEYARIGERYQPVLDKIKTMLAIDEGSFDEEAQDLLGEARDEHKKLKDKYNKLVSKNMELEKDAQEMAANIYLREKCEGLPEKQKERVMKLLEDVSTKDEIDKKFKVLTEDYKFELNEKTMYCKDCEKEVEVNENDENPTCPECSGELSEKKPEKGKTNEELENGSPEYVDESDIRNVWKQMIRENRY
ncbi:MAG: hypothetical protein ACOC1K_08305 [Nanoarchaeota archaeon]